MPVIGVLVFGDYVVNLTATVIENVCSGRLRMSAVEDPANRTYFGRTVGPSHTRCGGTAMRTRVLDVTGKFSFPLEACRKVV